MKLLYVLISSEADFYCEQALISMMSAKYHMPRCRIALLVDEATERYLAKKHSLINEYIDEKKIVNVNKEFSSMRKSRWLKTSMRNLIDGDFLYIDVDTVFAGPIDENLFSSDVMGVLDANMPIKMHPMKEFIIDNLKKLQFGNCLDFHINSGVLYFKDSPVAHSFAEIWHKRWEESCSKGIIVDQPALHQAIIDSGEILKLLPDYMNAQFGRNINTLADGIILHYYSSWANDSVYTPAFKFLQKEWLQEFRNNPKSESSKKIIYNPKKAFDTNSIIMGQNFDIFFHSKLGHKFASLRMSTNNADIRLFQFLEWQNEFVSKLYYKIIKFFYPIKKILK